jgi:acetyltransferase
MTAPKQANKIDRTREDERALDVILAPRSVAVIGGAEGPDSVGCAILENLIGSPHLAHLYPVALSPPGTVGLRGYPRIGDVPGPIDLAVIVALAPLVPDIVGQCVDAGVRGAIITSAGFRDAGPGGVELEQEILAEARMGRLRLLGPISFGVMSPFLHLNATPAGVMAEPGHVAFLGQSGGLCSAVLDWSLRERIGLSTLVSVGSMLDIGWGERIDYLGDDPHTRSIVIHMESIDDAGSLLLAARAVAPTKPIIVLKARRVEGPAESDEILDAAFRRCGVARVRRLSDLFSMAEVLAKQPRPQGPRLTIMTNGGGPGVVAADALLASGGVLAQLTPQTVAELDALLPAQGNRDNPFDLRDDAGPDSFARAVECVTADPNTDGLLVILTPQPMADLTGTAERLQKLSQPEGKPILASWMGGTSVLAGEELLDRAGICKFAHPDIAARAFCSLWKYSDNLRALDESSTAPESADGDLPAPDLEATAAIARAVRRSRRTLLDEVESLHLLAAYGIPTVPTFAASSAEEAVSVAMAMGDPVALRPRIDSVEPQAVTRWVRRDLVDAESVRRAYAALDAAVRQKVGPVRFRGVTVQPMIDRDGYKLFAGSRTDPRFGPVLLFGSGGRLSAIIEDRAFGLPPLSPTLARRMMERTRVYQALKGGDGREPVDLAALERILVRLGRLAVEQPWINQIDINPLLSSSEGVLASDARIVAWGPELPEDERPRPVLA